MLNLLIKIPIDIIYFKIRPYTYLIQSEQLLLDIKNFSNTKKIVFNLYYSLYYHLLKYEKNADKYWLVSDLILFIKKNNFLTYRKINKLYHNLISLNKCINYQFNIFWSRITPNERDLFIKINEE